MLFFIVNYVLFLKRNYNLDSSAIEGLKENCSVFDDNREDGSNQGSSRISESDMLFEASRYSFYYFYPK